MAWYRLYLMDRAGHIRDAVDIDCEDDVQALAAAERNHAGPEMELWQCDRRVKLFPAHPPEEIDRAVRGL